MQKASANSKKTPGQSNNIPDKLFYKIGEVSRITKTEPYVLRYWETEFPFLKPRKSKSGQRAYIKKDLELVLKIKELLYDEKYTIEGVRLRLDAEGLRKQKEDKGFPADTLQYIKNRLQEILDKIK